MGKMKFKHDNRILRSKIESYYRSKYYSLYLNAFIFEGLDYMQSRFLLSELWEKGTCAFIDAFNQRDLATIMVGDETRDNNELILCPYAPSLTNIYNFPIYATPVNNRGVKFIESKTLQVNKDIVLIWGHTSHDPIRKFIDFFIEKLVNLEIALRIAIENQKLPRLVVCSYEDKAHFEELFQDIEDGKARVFVEADDPSKVNAVLNGGEFIIDKIYAQILNVDKEALSFLGVDNVGMVKKERENVDETNANNEEIDNNGNCFIDEMEKGFSQLEKVLGFKVSVKEKAPKVMELGEYNADDPSNQEDDEGGDE